MKTIRYLSTLTHLVKSLRSALHVPRGAWRRCSSSEWNVHSSLSRLALHHDEHTLHSVQLRFLG